MNEDKLLKIAYEAITEANRAYSKYKRPYASAHEFYGVLMEEVDELWDEIKKKDELRDIEAMKTESIQCVAVLLRFIDQL